MSLGGSLRQLGASLLLAGRDRLELAALDAEEELLRLTQAFARVLVCACLATLALAALTGAIVAALWESRVAALLVSAACFACAAGWFAWRIVENARSRPRAFAATLEELGRDAQALQGGSP